MATDQFFSTGNSPAEYSADGGGEHHWPPISDEAFWHATAPAGVRRQYNSGDHAGGWKRWRRHLLSHSGALLAKQLTEKLAGRRKMAMGALTWGNFGPRCEHPRLAWLLKMVDARPRESRELATEAPAYIEQWLGATADLHHWSPTADEAFEAVAWTRALTPLARVCNGEVWWQLLERLHDLALAAAVRLVGDPLADPLADQLACGELPWSLAVLFSEIEPCRQLAAGAAKGLSAGIADLLDGTGVPHGRWLSIFHRLVAIWTRCRLLAAAVSSKSGKSQSSDSSKSRCGGAGCWDADAEQEFFQAVREALRLTRHDGTPVLSETAETAELPQAAKIAWLSEIAVKLADAGDQRYRRTMTAIAAGRGSKKIRGPRSKRPVKKMPDPAVHSEWAKLAVMQSDWSSRSDRLTVAYTGSKVRIELQSNRQLLFRGIWEMEVLADGVLAEQKGSWSEVCWMTDADCDYLELETELGHSIRVQRQILLSHKDQFVLLADAILGETPSDLAYRGRLPLAAGIAACPAKETRELTLIAKKPRAVVLPLELPEWRVERRGDSLTTGTIGQVERDSAKEPHVETNGAATNGTGSHGQVSGIAAAKGSAADVSASNTPPSEILLSQSCNGCRLFAPLWIDLSTKRVRRQDRNPLTWRQLTVGEQRQILRHDAAVGYRVQCGKRQWVVYRSLAEPANRTLLGVNLSTDFFVGRFGTDGETESIVEIE